MLRKEHWYKILILPDHQKIIDIIILDVIKPVINSYEKQISSYFFKRSYHMEQHSIEFFINNNTEETIVKSYCEDIVNISIEKGLDMEVQVLGICEFTESEDYFGKYGDLFLSEYYCKTNNLVYDILERSNGEYSEKLDGALDTLIISADSSYGTIKRGYLSYCSHVNGFFTRWKNPQKIEEQFYEKYKQLSSYLNSKVSCTLINCTKNIEYENFKYMIIDLKKQLEEEFKNGNIEVSNNDENNNTGYRDFLDKSPFHREIINNPSFYNYMHNDPVFLSERLLTIFLYLFLQRLGIRNKDRYTLCYYIYLTVEDMYNLNSRDLIKSFGKEDESHEVY